MKGKTMENSSVTLHADHIKPWSKGGETVIENLQTLCSKCNIGKSDLAKEPKLQEAGMFAEAIVDFKPANNCE